MKIRIRFFIKLFCCFICVLLFSCGYANNSSSQNIAKETVEILLEKLASNKETVPSFFVEFFGRHSEYPKVVAIKEFCSKDDMKVSLQMLRSDLLRADKNKLSFTEDCKLKIYGLKVIEQREKFLEYLRQEFDLKNNSFSVESIKLIALEDKVPYKIVEVHIGNQKLEFYVYEENDLRETFGAIWKIEINNKPFANYVFSEK